MSLRENLSMVRQLVPLAGICAGYHMVKLVGNTIDAEDGFIEHRVSQLLAQRLLRHLDLSVEVRGADKVAGLHRYCVACSHASYLDWAVLLAYYPSPLRFVAKKELTRVPVIGDYLKLRGVLIDRRTGQTAKEAIAAAAYDGQPWPILIFPEGTRSPDGEIQPFKPGGLRLLAEAGRELVPACVAGTYAAFPRQARVIRTGVPLRLTIGEPVRPADFATADEAVAEVERRVRALRGAG
ncbi:MAG: 1-acyl-sn-glycerol-3-phosphate acyltransferase [Deltaproteobacteria bacterium]|nr:1-acyl-sn-glycerol-3-phosphate acyltransferase [Deltaproteobacteria bacterium]